MDSTGLMVQISFQHKLYKVKHDDKGEVLPVSPWIHFFVFTENTSEQIHLYIRLL